MSWLEELKKECSVDYINGINYVPAKEVYDLLQALAGSQKIEYKLTNKGNLDGSQRVAARGKRK